MTWVDKNQIKEKLGLSNSSLKRLRASGDFILGIHFQEIGSRPCWRAGDRRAAGKILYHLENCQHWIKTRHNPELHEQFCLQYQKSLAS